MLMYKVARSGYTGLLNTSDVPQLLVRVQEVSLGKLSVKTSTLMSAWVQGVGGGVPVDGGVDWSVV